MKEIRVLLIKPPCTIFGDDPTVPSATLPFGLAYLAAYLLERGVKVEIIDAISEGITLIKRNKNKKRIGLPDQEIKRRILRFKPRIVGISSMFTAYSYDVHHLAALIKKIDPDIKVVLGGAHASIFPKLSIKDKNVDLVVIGEGEISFWQFVQAVKNNKNYHDLPGTVSRKGKKILANPPRSYIENLDHLPFPAYHLLPMEAYFKTAKSSPYLMYSRQSSLISSRGCPGDCSYCSIHSVWGHRWRGRSPENVVDELEFLVKQYGLKEFAFLDDSVACSKQRMNKICDEIIKRQLNLKWTTPNGISHWTLDEALLDKMKTAGCYRITFGIESGNLKTREFIGWKKNFSLNQAKRLIKYANKIGLWTVATFILGFPYEGRESINETINYAIDSDVDFAIFFLLMPFPGTKAYEVFKKEGLLDFDDLLDPSIKGREARLAKLGAALAQKGCQTKHFTPEELQDFLAKAYTQFWQARFISFLNPIRIARKIKSPTGLRYALRMIFVGLKLKFKQLGQRKFSIHMANSQKQSL